MKLTPVKDFTETILGKSWLDVVSEPQFQNATKAAILEYSRRLAGTPDGGVRLLGAYEFLECLMSLGEKRTPVTRTDTINLQ